MRPSSFTAVSWPQEVTAEPTTRTYISFFADHYYRDWFSTWEPRWYTGFTTVSYPPGIHQLLAALRGFLGSDGAYIAAQLGSLLLLVIGVYRFSDMWVGRRAAGWAALGAVLSSSIAEVVHVFGQLPTTLALALLLNAQPSIRRWLIYGKRSDLVAALAFIAGTTAVHHVTTLFGSVFFVGPVVARVLLDAFAMPIDDELPFRLSTLRPRAVLPAVARRLRRVLPAFRRTAGLGAATVGTLILVVLPYWLWSSSDPIVQVPIPHGSRDNFIKNLNVGLVFWLTPWASVLLLLPAALLRGFRQRAWPLAASVAVLFVLGTGGTTPLPRLVLRGAFDILTLDRFTIWATILVLPLAAPIVDWIVDTSRNIDLRQALGRHAPKAVLAILMLAALGSTLFGASLASLRPMQPDTVDPEPIVTFMAKDSHDRWRYLLLGFGDQMAAISAQTNALTVDGNYHSARRLPELTSRSVERLEGAKFRGVEGLGSLQQFVGDPERYNLKFVFSNDAFYDPLLWSYGWNRLGSLDNNVMVWERDDIAPLPLVQATKEIPTWQRLMWGLLPPTAVISALGAFAFILVGRDDEPLGSPIHRSTILDRWLKRRAERMASSADGRQTTRHVTFKANQRRILPHPQFQLRTGALLCALLIAVPGPASLLLRPDAAPADAVVDFYKDLARQRYEDAWSRLDPQSRTPLADYLQDRSLRDGLFDGYAELDDIEIIAESITRDEAIVAVRLEYLTAVEVFVVEREHELVATPDGWKIVADPLQARRSQPGLVAATLTEFSQATVVVDRDRPVRAADRPQLRVGSAHGVKVDGRWSVIGEVTNIDGVPAQVSVEASLLDEDGLEIAQSTATLATVHVLLPGESTTYRVDFENPVPGEFDAAATGTADAALPSELDVADISVAVRSVRSDYRTSRDLALAAVAIDDEGVLTADVVNAGIGQATVASVLLTTFDETGQPIWVRNTFVPSVINPGDRISITTDITPPNIEESIRPTPGPAASSEDHLVIEGVSGVTSLSVRIANFSRVGAP